MHLFKLKTELSICGIQLFAASLHREGLQLKMVKSYVAGLKFWFQLIHNKEIPGIYSIAKTLRGMARESQDLPDSWAPLSINLLLNLIRYLPVMLNHYQVLLHRAMFAVAFYGCLCISEFTKSPLTDHNILEKTVTFDDKVLTFSLLSSKTHIKEDPSQVVCLESQYYIFPIEAIKAYVAVKCSGCTYFKTMQATLLAPMISRVLCCSVPLYVGALTCTSWCTASELGGGHVFITA